MPSPRPLESSPRWPRVRSRCWPRIRAGWQAPSTPRVLVLPFAVHADATGAWRRRDGALDPRGRGGPAERGLRISSGSGHSRAINGSPRSIGCSCRRQRSFSRATTILIGELVGASEVVFGEIRVGSTINLRVRVIDLQSSRQLPDVIDEGALADLFAVFERVSGRLAQTLGRRVIAAPRRAASVSLDAFEQIRQGPRRRHARSASAVSRGRDDAGAARWRGFSRRSGPSTRSKARTTRRWRPRARWRPILRSLAGHGSTSACRSSS